MRIVVAKLSWPVLGGLGAAVGLMIGKRMGEGTDPIFYPLLWTTPLGACIGLAHVTFIAFGMVVSRKK